MRLPVIFAIPLVILVALFGAFAAIVFFKMIFRGCSSATGTVSAETGRSSVQCRQRGPGLFAVTVCVVMFCLFVPRFLQGRSRHASEPDVVSATEPTRVVLSDRAITDHHRAIAVPALLQDQQPQAEKSVPEPPQAERPVTPESERAELLARLRTLVDAIEDSNVPLSSVEMLRQVRRLQSVVDHLVEPGPEIANAAKVPTDPPDPADGSVILAEAMPGMPVWFQEATAGPATDVIPVSGSPKPSKKAARQDMLARAAELLAADYRDHFDNVDRDWVPRMDRLPLDIIRREVTVQGTWDYGAGTDLSPSTDLTSEVYQTFAVLRSGPDVRSALFRQWRHRTSEYRLQSVMWLGGGMVLIIGLFAGYLRLSQNRGFFRRTARFGLLVVGVCVVVALVRENAGPGMDSLLENHLGEVNRVEAVDVRDARHENPEIRHHAANTDESHLFGIPIHGDRVAFVVAGDHRFRDSGKLDRVNQAIIDCLKTRRDTEYAVFFETSNGVAQRKGRARNDGRSTFTAVSHAGDLCFRDNARATGLVNSGALLKRFRPQTVVFIRDSEADAAPIRREDFINRFSRAGVPTICIEVGGTTNDEANLSELAERTRGRHLVWNPETNQTVLDQNFGAKPARLR